MFFTKVLEFIKFKFGVFHVHHFGSNNKDVVFFIIRDCSPKVGVLAEWFRVCCAINYAQQKKFIPIIDFKNSDLPIIADKELSAKQNVWDLYFNQPYNFTLNDVYESKHVIFCPSIWSKHLNPFSPYISESIYHISLIDSSRRKLLNQFYNKYSFSSEIIELALFYRNKFFPKNDKVLGVSYRRCFEQVNSFKNTGYDKHPVRMNLDDFMNRINEKLNMLGYKYFFLTIDDRESCSYIKEKFNEKCIVTDKPLTRVFKNGIPIRFDNFDEMNQEFKNKDFPIKYRNVTYLAEVYLLSMCDSLLSSGGSGDALAYIINNGKYEHVFSD